MRILFPEAIIFSANDIFPVKNISFPQRISNSTTNILDPQGIIISVLKWQAKYTRLPRPSLWKQTKICNLFIADINCTLREYVFCCCVIYCFWYSIVLDRIFSNYCITNNETTRHSPWRLMIIDQRNIDTMGLDSIFSIFILFILPDSIM